MNPPFVVPARLMCSGGHKPGWLFSCETWVRHHNG